METIALRELLEAVHGELLAEFDLDAPIPAVDTDSRKIAPGGLFIPLAGERFDGHDFIPAALEGGAAGCLCAGVPEKLLPGKFYVRVEDTTRALGDLARWYRGRFDIPFVCVTGSVGKTTTKDMIASVLAQRFQVLKTQKSYNNAIGLPLTLLGLDRSVEICVLELGMNHAGEIEYLTSIVRPDVAAVTNVGDAHIENLGSREGIFRAKCEIFTHMGEKGLAVLSGDDELLSTLRGKLPFETVFVGAGEGLDYQAKDIAGGVQALSCTAAGPKGSFHVRVPAPGRHMIYPALTAAAVGEHFGMTGEEIARGIAAFHPTEMRMNVRELPGGVTILDDAYNANPQSMAAAAAVLGEAEDRRRVAVVGDMLELGEESERFHREVGAAFAGAGTDKLIAVGEFARYIACGADEAGLAETAYYTDVETALPDILSEKRPGAAILVKASRAMHFEKIVEALTS